MLKFQQGRDEDGVRLIEYYKPLIQSLVKLIKYKEFNPRSYTQKCFLSMFAKDRSTSFGLRNQKANSAVIAGAQSVLNMLQGFYRFEDEEDIRQDVIEILLSTLKKFRNYEGSNINGYVNTAFVANLARRCKNITKDPLVNLANDKIVPFCEFPPCPDDTAMVAGFSEVCRIAKETDFFLHEEDELGANWINGTTCSEPFAMLTPIERTILKLKYYEGYTWSEVSAITGLKQKSVGIRMERIANKMKGLPVDEAYCVRCGKEFYDELIGRRGNQLERCNECRNEEPGRHNQPKVWVAERKSKAVETIRSNSREA